jgi:hypothetical protein
MAARVVVDVESHPHRVIGGTGERRDGVLEAGREAQILRREDADATGCV